MTNFEYLLINLIMPVSALFLGVLLVAFVKGGFFNRGTPKHKH